MEIVIKSQKICYLDEPAPFSEAVKILQQRPAVAVDTESDSLYVYYEKVCLIQLSDSEQNFIADPLVLGDISELDPLFRDRSVQKVFHAAEYDIMCLKRDYGFEFNNIFDTMIAARILGRKEIGLGALIEQEFGILLDKKFQKANWGVRPLSENMLLYAAMDTSYLLELRDRLEQELIERELFALAQEDFEQVCKVSPAAGHPLEIHWWKAAGNNRDLTFEQAAALQGLCHLREQIAKKSDLPPFKVMQNEVLLALAIEQPKRLPQLAKFKGLRKGLIQKHGKAILNVIEESKTIKDLERPVHPPKPSAASLNLRELLKTWRKTVGLQFDVPSDVILPKDVLERIAMKKPRDKNELKTIMADFPWRFNRFSNDILDVLRE